MKKLTAAGLDWANILPSEELAQAIEQVLPTAQKLGMSRDDVRSMFADMAAQGMTNVEVAALSIRKAMEETVEINKPGHSPLPKGEQTNRGPEA